jgi:5S rRNA maturation endonuclease (ribonuclease M5)
MTVKEMIEQLKKCDQDKVVVLTEPDGKGWDNIGIVIENVSTVKITMDGDGLFQES